MLNTTRDGAQKPQDQPFGQTSSQTSGQPVAPDRRGKPLLHAALSIGVVVLAFLAMKMLIATKPEVATRPAREQVYTVEAVTGALALHTPDMTLYGEVVAGRSVELRALVAGQVVSVSPNLRIGAVVEAGDPLVTIDRFTYEGAVLEARANVAEARAGLIEAEARVASGKANLSSALEQETLASRDLERAVTLLARGSMTEKQRDDRSLIFSQRQQAVVINRNALAVEEARLAQQRAALERLEWRLEQAERNLADTVLKAPFAGVVRAESVEAGRLVGVNDVVAALYARDQLDVRFTLSDEQYGRLSADSAPFIGRPVRLEWSMGAETVRVQARIERIGAEIASARGGVDVFARVEAGDGSQKLRPGAFVTLTVPDRAYEATQRLPETAVYENSHVFVIVDERLQRRDVEVVSWDGDQVLVRGTLDGQQIVTTRIAEAGEGVKVRLFGEPVRREGHGDADTAAEGS